MRTRGWDMRPVADRCGIYRRVQTGGGIAPRTGLRLRGSEEAGTMSRQDLEWKREISASSGGLSIREVLAYKDLVALFVKRDFAAAYKQTILGPLWLIIDPLLTTVVFTVVFGNLANLPTMDVEPSSISVPSFLFYMSGNMLWSYFSGTVGSVSRTFIDNAHVMSKVYYPRIASPVAKALFNTATLGIRLAIFFAIFAASWLGGIVSARISVRVLLLPVVVLQLALLGLGVGMLLAAATAKYRDLAMLVGFGLQLWMYASPVAYGLSLVPEKWLWLFMLNPAAPAIAAARYACFGDGWFSVGWFAMGFAASAAAFFLGAVAFGKAERNFVDVI